MPVEEEGRLNDPRLRENFIERVFAYRRLALLFTARWSIRDVVRFHTIHKLTLVAHRPESYQRLGRLVASGKSMDRHGQPLTIKLSGTVEAWFEDLGEDAPVAKV